MNFQGKDDAGELSPSIFVPLHAPDLADSTNSPLYEIFWKPIWLRWR